MYFDFWFCSNFDDFFSFKYTEYIFMWLMILRTLLEENIKIMITSKNVFEFV